MSDRMGSLRQYAGGEERGETEGEDVDHDAGDDLIHPVLDGEDRKHCTEERTRGQGSEQPDPGTKR